MPLLDPLLVRIVRINNGLSLDLPLAQIVLKDVTHALMALLATLVLQVMPKIQKIPAQSALLELMPLLDQRPVPLVLMINGLQLAPVLAQLVFVDVICVQIQLPVTLALTDISRMALSVLNVQLELMPLPDQLAVQAAALENGQQLAHPLVQIVSLIVIPALIALLVALALLAISKTQEILVLNVQQALTLPRDLLPVLLVVQANGLLMQQEAVQVVSIIVMLAQMVLLVILAQLDTSRMATLVLNVQLELMPLLEQPLVLNVAIKNGQQLELIAVQIVFQIVTHVLMVPHVILALMVSQRMLKAFVSQLVVEEILTLVNLQHVLLIVLHVQVTLLAKLVKMVTSLLMKLAKRVPAAMNILMENV